MHRWSSRWLSTAQLSPSGALASKDVSQSRIQAVVFGEQPHCALELVRLNTADGQRIRLNTEGFSQDFPTRAFQEIAAKVGIKQSGRGDQGRLPAAVKAPRSEPELAEPQAVAQCMTSRGDPAEIPAETRMTFRLREAITVTEKLN